MGEYDHRFGCLIGLKINVHQNRFLMKAVDEDVFLDFHSLGMPPFE